MLQPEILLDFLANEYVVSTTFTPANLRLTMYNTSKIVPVCKGWFIRTIHIFLLETVFSMTTQVALLYNQ